MKKVFYEMLSQQLDKIKYQQQLILAEDLNTRVGSRNLDKVIERFNGTTINDSGDRLINACKQHDLRIYDITYEHKNIYGYKKDSHCAKYLLLTIL
jgi:hypothetical protein